MLFFMITIGIANADDFDLDPDFDTGGPEEVLYDPSPIWPSKIITDALSQNILLVWFEHGHSRTITIPFASVSEIRVIPALEDEKEEVHLLTSDGKKFLIAIGLNSSSNVQSTAVVIGKIPVRVKPTSKRIQSKPPTPRPTPLLQMGKIDAPDVLLDPANITTTLPEDIKPIEPNNVTQSIGEDPATIAGNGTLAKSDINSIVAAEMNRFRACYQREFQKNNSLEGEVVVQFSIGPEGTVKGAKVKSTTLSNALVEQCILRNFLGLRFPPPAGGMATPIINYPFIFSVGY